MDKKKIYLILNALLVIIVGAIVAIACADDIFSAPVGIVAYVCFLIALCIPAPIYLLESKMNLGFVITGVLFAVAELVVNILFMINTAWEFKIFAICQASIIGVVLVVTMLNVVAFPKNDEPKE